MTDFATEGMNYDALAPDVLNLYIVSQERGILAMQSQLARATKDLAAMRKAQRRQATLAKGSKLPQHTKHPDSVR